MPKIGKLLPVFIGVDPGLEGGIAVLNNGNATLYRMPETEGEVLDLFQKINFRTEPLLRVAVIEEIMTSIFGINKASMSKLYGSYCSLRMALIATGVREFEAILGKDWQKALGLRRKMKKESRTSWKGYLCEEARKRYPRLTVWDGTKEFQRAVCDALLIAHYSQRKWKGIV